MNASGGDKSFWSGLCLHFKYFATKHLSWHYKYHNTTMDINIYREKSCIQLLDWLQIIFDLDEIILFQLMRYYEYGLDVVVVAIKTFTLWTGH